MAEQPIAKSNMESRKKITKKGAPNITVMGDVNHYKDKDGNDHYEVEIAINSDEPDVEIFSVDVRIEKDALTDDFEVKNDLKIEAPISKNLNFSLDFGVNTEIREVRLKAAGELAKFSGGAYFASDQAKGPHGGLAFGAPVGSAQIDISKEKKTGNLKIKSSARSNLGALIASAQKTVTFGENPAKGPMGPSPMRSVQTGEVVLELTCPH